MTDNKMPASTNVLYEIEQNEMKGEADVESHCLQMALYLQKDDSISARLLLKRIPSDMKNYSELKALAEIAHLLFKRDYPAIYAAIGRFEWSETIKPLMEQFGMELRQRAAALVAKAYSSIEVNAFAQLVGVNAEQALAEAQANGWHYDGSKKMLYPVRQTMAPADVSINVDQVQKFAEFVSNLEN